MKKNLEYFITEYLKNAPLFMSFIRPTEAMLFYENLTRIKKPVLDFGCGDGFFAKTVFGKKIDVGIDLQKNPRVLIAQDKKIYKKLVTYDGTIMPFKNNFFQTIISNCVLEHIPHVEQSVSEIYRVLQKGGCFLTTVMTDNWSSMMLGSKVFGKPYAKWLNNRQEHHSILSKNTWDNIFIKKGFTILKKKGYVSDHQAKFLDLFHYLSLFSLLSYKLTNRWVLFPQFSSLWKKFIIKNLTNPISKKYAAFFYVLKK